jgi:hypothetical protein
MKTLTLVLVLMAAGFLTAHAADYFWYEPDGRVDFEVSQTSVTVQVDFNQPVAHPERSGG